MTDKRYRIGIWVSGLYLLTLTIYAYVQRDAVLDMVPNEFGDALAGAASPLAFLWLVLGYLQQGVELRQNTEALNMQVKELQASVDQQRALVETTQRQHEFELGRDKEQRRAAFLSNQPVFDVQLASAPSLRKENLYRATMTNIGRQCSRVALYVDEDHALQFEGDDAPLIFMNGTSVEMTIAFAAQHAGRDIGCVICYTDWFGEGREQRFTIRVAKTRTGDLFAFIPAPPMLVFLDDRAGGHPTVSI